MQNQQNTKGSDLTREYDANALADGNLIPSGVPKFEADGNRAGSEFDRYRRDSVAWTNTLAARVLTTRPTSLTLNGDQAQAIATSFEALQSNLPHLQPTAAPDTAPSSRR